MVPGGRVGQAGHELGTPIDLGRPHAGMRKDRLVVTEGFQQDLGQRIVRAARMAVAVHLYESAAERTNSPGGEVALRIASQILRRRQLGTGGAGSHRTAAGADIPCPADLVTDDERDELIGRDADDREPPER